VLFDVECVIVRNERNNRLTSGRRFVLGLNENELCVLTLE